MLESEAVAIEKIRLFVPLRTMSSSHLQQLANNCRIEVVCAGQTLLTAWQNTEHCYLLSGKASVRNPNREVQTITAGHEESSQPLGVYREDQGDVIALTDCTVAFFDALFFSKILCWDQVAKYLTLDISYERDLDEDAEWMLTVLKSNLFYKIPPINIDTIFHKMTPMLVESGDVILRQGEIGDGCYFIKEGEAVVTRSCEDGRNTKTLAVWGDGACFGEDALINQTVRNATVKMLCNGVLMFLGKNDFIELLRVEPTEKTSIDRVNTALQKEVQLIDVRTTDEFEFSHIESAINIPLDILRLKQRMLDKDCEYIIYSMQAARGSAASTLLNKKGFKTSVLEGGLKAFARHQPKQLIGRFFAPNVV